MSTNLKNKFEELNMTSDEIKRFTEAMKKEEFRKLLVEYAEEISDPKNREIYEKEISQLEQERGMDVTFIHPEPGFCLKTTQNGSKKCFINICKNPNIDKPSSHRDQTGKTGLHWQIPHTCSQPREDAVKSGEGTCIVYDVVFNPDSYRMGETNQRFNKLLIDSALETIEKNFKLKLDRVNYKILKHMNFKGKPTASIIRRPAKNSPEETVEVPPNQEDLIKPLIDQLKDQYIENQVKKSQQNLPKTTEVDKKPVVSDEPAESGFTKPNYKIIYRGSMDMQDHANQLDNTIVNSTRPKEIVITIELPLCKSSANTILDIFEKRLYLESHDPNYKLDLNLSYPVNEKESKAKFDKSKKCLVVTLPVVPFVAKVNIVDTDDESNEIKESEFKPSSSSSSESSSECPSPDIQPESLIPTVLPFLNTKNVKYTLPEKIEIYENDENINIRVRINNLDKKSVKMQLNSQSKLTFKCVSESSSGFTQNYAGTVKFHSKKPSVNEQSLCNLIDLKDSEFPFNFETDLNSVCLEHPDDESFLIRIKKSIKDLECKFALASLESDPVCKQDGTLEISIIKKTQIEEKQDKNINKMSKKDYIMNFENISKDDKEDDDDDDDQNYETPLRKVNLKDVELLKLKKNSQNTNESQENGADEEEEHDDNNNDNDDDEEEDDDEDKAEKEDENNNTIRFEQTSHISINRDYKNDDEDALASSLNSNSSFSKLKGILKKPRSYSESESSLMSHRSSMPSIDRNSFESGCNSNSDENMEHSSLGSSKKCVHFNKQVVRNVFKPGSTVCGMRKPSSSKNKKKNKRKRTVSDPSHDSGADAISLKDSAGRLRPRSISESSDDSSSILTNSNDSINKQINTSICKNKNKNKKGNKNTAKQAGQDNSQDEEVKNPFDMETMLQWKNQGRLNSEVDDNNNNTNSANNQHNTNCAFKFKNKIINDLDD